MLSAIWNSYTRAPLDPDDVPLRTVSVGRSVASCVFSAGESDAGAVSAELPPDGLDGEVGVS